jgi:hypothetical protein
MAPINARTVRIHEYRTVRQPNPDEELDNAEEPDNTSTKTNTQDGPEYFKQKWGA